MPEHALQILLIFCCAFTVAQRDLFKSVILYSVFSLVCATLYLTYDAPDVALAEVAVGAAFVPVIFIAAISKQKDFVVVSYVFDDFLSRSLVEGDAGSGYELLANFCSLYGLRLVLCPNEDKSFCGFLSPANVDLFILKSGGVYVLRGRSSSLLMNRLRVMASDYGFIEVEMVEDEEIFE